MKLSTTNSEPAFIPLCRDFRTRYCYDQCNWFGCCADFDREAENDIDTGNVGSAEEQEAL